MRVPSDLRHSAALATLVYAAAIVAGALILLVG